MGIRAARYLGAGFCSPLEHALVPGPQAGHLPTAHSFCSIDHPNVLLSTIKHAEDGDGTIVRLLETEGLDATVIVDLPFLGFQRAFRTNLAEEGGTQLDVEGSRFAIHLGPWCAATVRLL
jgi:alpha-mannosidase